MVARLLNLYVAYSYTPAFWALDQATRRNVRAEIAQSSQEVGDARHLYGLFPQRSNSDFLIWTAWEADEAPKAKSALTHYATVAEQWRQYVSVVDTLWGFTRPSMYSRGKSEQDMDPLEGPRSPYLVIYPFSKTKEWYLMSMDSRQGMMNEHIKLGKQYFDVKQLLLYSFGLQDQEFVVSYEMDELVRFSELVNALRATEARRYTLLDTPIITGVYLAPEEFVR